MSKSTLATHSIPFNVVPQVDRPERLLGRTAQPLHHTEMEPSEDDSATMDACNVVFEYPKLQRQAVGSVDQPDTTDPRRSINVYQATLPHLFIAKVERQVAGRF